MSLFGKKKVENTECSCGGNCSSEAAEKEVIKECSCGGNCCSENSENREVVNKEGAVVKILGSGCKKCNELEANTVAALNQLGMDTHVDHVTDFSQIAAYGVMSTPALVFNGKVVSYGKVLKTEEVVKILQKVAM